MMKRFLLIIALAALLALPVMAAQDISTTLGAYVGLGTAEYTADVTGDAVNMGNFGASMIVIQTASGSFDTAKYWKFQLLECDTSDGTFTEVVTADVIGATPDASGTIHTINATQTTPLVAKYGYVGEKKYLKIRLDETGTATITASVAIIGGRPRISPVD